MSDESTISRREMMTLVGSAALLPLTLTSACGRTTTSSAPPTAAESATAP